MLLERESYMHSTQEEPLYMNRLTKRQREVRAEVVC
jgi:hypothetical protein